MVRRTEIIKLVPSLNDIKINLTPRPSEASGFNPVIDCNGLYKEANS